MKLNVSLNFFLIAIATIATTVNGQDTDPTPCSNAKLRSDIYPPTCEKTDYKIIRKGIKRVIKSVACTHNLKIELGLLGGKKKILAECKTFLDRISPPPIGDPVTDPPIGDPVSDPPIGDPVSDPPIVDPVSDPPIGDPVSDPPINEPVYDEDSLDRWWQVFGRGSLRNDVDPTLWEAGSPFIPLDREFYIRRICPNCRDSHKDIIYKRVTPLSADFDLPSLFLDTWSSEDNILITPDNTEGDFELYSSMSFALAGLMPWQFCNYDDNHIGFPRDCSPQSFTGGQWNSLNRGGQSDYGYYVWNGNLDL